MRIYTIIWTEPLLTLQALRKRKKYFKYMPKLTEFSKDVILAQVKAVGGYNGVKELEFVLTDNDLTSKND